MANHCCERMKIELARDCGPGVSRSSCPDALIAYGAKFDEYGIVVHDGGASAVAIHYCPWCGQRLPASKRDHWFDELEALGVDPLRGPIPAEYETDLWWITKRNGS